MYEVLIVDDSVLDGAFAVEVLQAGLAGVHVVHTTRKKYAEHCKRHIDLMLLDIKGYSLAVKEMIALLRTYNPEAVLQLTSSCEEDVLSQITMKLDARGYLFKPFRPLYLLAMVSPYVQAAAGAASPVSEEERCEQECAGHLALLRESVQEYAYKKSLDITKKYLDSLYKITENKIIIRQGAVSFAEGIVALGEQIGAELRYKLSSALERFRARYDLQGRKYDTYLSFREMLNALFDEMERRNLYFDDDMKKVLNYIDRNIKNGIGLEKVAEYVNMSSCYFSKFFKRKTGMNFIDYVTNCKIEYAKEMLGETDMPVVNIAYELAYSETNYFSKTFKKKVGMTPTEYRELAEQGRVLQQSEVG